MTSLLTHVQYNATSAAGAMVPVRACENVELGYILVSPAASTSPVLRLDVPMSASRPLQTTAGAPVPSSLSAGAAISELRRISGLTWDQLAKVFAVSRRTLHFWASGKPPTAGNEALLHRVLGAVRKIDRGSASATRLLLLEVRQDGKRLLDLIVAGQHEQVVAILGPGSPRMAALAASNAEVLRARAPRPPEELVDALQDRVHQDIGVFRVAKSVRPRSGR